MISTGWYFNHEGHLVEYTGSTLQHQILQDADGWVGPFSSEHAAVHVWEFRQSEMVR